MKVWIKKIANIAARAFVPGVSQIEDAIKDLHAGGDKADAVQEIIEGGLKAAAAFSGSAMLRDPEFKRGMDQILQGYAAVAHAVDRAKTGA